MSCSIDLPHPRFLRNIAFTSYIQLMFENLVTSDWFVCSRIKRVVTSILS